MEIAESLRGFYLEVWDIIAAEHNLSIAEVKQAFIQALKESNKSTLGYGEIVDELVKTKYGEKIYFYEIFYNSFGKECRKRIMPKRNNFKKIEKAFNDNLKKLDFQYQAKLLKSELHKVFNGKILAVNNFGLKVRIKINKTFYNAFAPNALLDSNEMYKVGFEMNFELYKVNAIKDTSKKIYKLNIVLARNTIAVIKEKLKDILRDYGFCGVQRKGKLLLISLSEFPPKHLKAELEEEFNLRIKFKIGE